LRAQRKALSDCSPQARAVSPQVEVPPRLVRWTLGASIQLRH